MKVCAIVFKPCWQDSSGQWMSSGGYALQMTGMASLFDEITLVVARRDTPGEGGMPLPESARVVALQSPRGRDFQRKLSFAVHLPYYVSNIVKLIRDVDVVHAPPPGDIPMLGVILGLIMRKKLIIRYAGSWQVNSQTTSSNKLARAIMRFIAGGRNAVFATGEGTTNPGHNISWLFSTAISALELRDIQPDVNRGLHNPPRVAYIGRLSYEKGVRNLIRAVVQMKQEGEALPDVVLIGDGPERNSLFSLVRELGLERNIRFAGQLDRRALSETLRTMDLCVQPSLTEGFSKAWLDAFAHGLPVIASEVGAANSVVGKATERGWLVPPGDVTALAGALKRVFKVPTDWKNLRRRCREYVETRTIEAWAHRMGSVCAAQWEMKLVEGKLRA